ncbi:multicopper oxidase domain-containing protein [Streptomyces sp. NBC_01174]|uniref:multicopper oxidase family protein n=1 Tax=Streptomyces sp. NBC_01174 TaxID=2903758 RepID=UPI00386C25B0|nr:multicopper oxidase family protein [Streptomyces sp. NBC_01177]WSS75551.1 multicopper oxidase family protein [Streptomyces sp. NBC_01174]
MSEMPTRRALLGAGIALAGTAGLASRAVASPAVASPAPASPSRAPSPARAADQYVTPDGPEVVDAENRRGAGPLRKVSLTAAASRLDLGGGLTVPTWAYGDRLPGEAIRITAGDTLELALANHLTQSTTMHWHGLSIRNDMDGVPALTQQPVKAGADFTYRFAVTHPGTHWIHPHSGVQLDRGLYAPLIVEDPEEPLAYDKEWVVVLDDWLDGVDGSTPDAVLDELTKGRGAAHDAAGHDSARAGRAEGPSRLLEGARSDLLGGHAGDVAYPHYLVNGRRSEDPSVFEARPGDRIRLRVINAGGDTAFRLALGGHRMTVTHTDGFPVRHTETDALLLGMGERYDVLVTAGDGVFPLTALAEGKGASALAVLRTGTGALPPASVRPAELDGELVTADRLAPDESVALAEREPDRTVRITLTGSMAAYDWGFDGKSYDPAARSPVRAGERVRLVFTNRTAMWHPLHLHGHTFALAGTGQGAGPGARKDTAAILPGRTLTVDFDADNPGLWMLHCHNVYHAEAGMMTVLGYLR